MGDERQADFRAERRRALGLPVIAPGIRAPFQSHSETSQRAAQAIDGSLNALQLEVLRYLRACGAEGATDDELQRDLAMNPSTQRPRRIELLAKGLICDAGMKRKTRSGRLATVWIAR